MVTFKWLPQVLMHTRQHPEKICSVLFFTFMQKILQLIKFYLSKCFLEFSLVLYLIFSFSVDNEIQPQSYKYIFMHVKGKSGAQARLRDKLLGPFEEST